MTREEMLTEVIRTRGFEDKWTIWFAELMENKTISDNALQKAMVAAITMPFGDEDEDYSSSSFFMRGALASGPARFSIISQLSSFVNRQIIQRSEGKISRNWAKFFSKTA